ncbi:hypothetical protein CPB86DRAFT_786839 [Serendipita vermifera]|nr:hypothetical protein CPB86DRAFT_786839 [Serendipita vermifera]
MRVLPSLYPIAYLVVLVSALATVHDSNPLVVNENSPAAPGSMIEALDTVRYGGGGDDDPEEECDISDDVEGQFARNDPQCRMVPRVAGVLCQSNLCLGTARDNTGGYCHFNAGSGRCCMRKMRGNNAHIACLHCRCRRS